MSEKIKNFFRQNIGYFIIVLVSTVYILTALISMSKTNKTFEEIIADGSIALLLGLFVNRVFELQGLINGENDEKMKHTLSLHSNMVMEISSKIDKLGEWCRRKNIENLRFQRTRILSEMGLRYSDFFNSDGALAVDFNKNYCFENDENKIKKLKKKCVKKALKIKLTQISASSLTSEGEKDCDPFNFGRTKKQYSVQASASDLFVKFGTALLFGYYGVELITNFSYASLIWKSLQVAVFLIMGIVKMMNSYFFVVDEFRSKIIKKIDNLQMFYNEEFGQQTNSLVLSSQLNLQGDKSYSE